MNQNPNPKFERSETSPPKQAPLHLRMVAFLIDWTLISIAFTILGILYAVTLGMILVHIPFIGPLLHQFGYQILYSSVFILYHTYFEGGNEQATYGKQLCGLKINCSDGKALDWKKSSLRGAGKLLSKAVFLLGFLLAFIRSDRKAFHDLILSTDVVSFRKPHPKIEEITSRFPL